MPMRTAPSVSSVFCADRGEVSGGGGKRVSAGCWGDPGGGPCGGCVAFRAVVPVPAAPALPAPALPAPALPAPALPAPALPAPTPPASTPPASPVAGALVVARPAPAW